MPEMCTLIGDVIGSRHLPDRLDAQARIQDALADVDTIVISTQALEPTVGDEFQGAYDKVADGALAALLLRLALLPEIDVRIGLGFGQVQLINADRRPLLQDGPGWWAAREALDDLSRPRTLAHTAYVGPGSAEISAFLVVRDSLVDRLGARGLRLLDGALRGRSQAELAADEGIGRPAVSGQFARGVGAVVQAHRDLSAAVEQHRRGVEE